MFYGLSEAENRVVHYFIQNLDYDGTESSKLPFTFVLENNFKKKKIIIQETHFKFGVDEVESFLQKYGIKKDHFVCFDEILCQNYTKDFVDGLKQMKQNVSGLWLAIGGKSTTGRFGRNGIKKAGFVCPEMSYPLRNPLLIAKRSHR